MPEIKINLNGFCKVKLTEAGKNELKRQSENLVGEFPHLKKTFEYKEPVENSEGYSKWQMWNLMSTFGHLFYMGNRDLPFENNEIIFEAPNYKIYLDHFKKDKKP